MAVAQTEPITQDVQGRLLRAATWAAVTVAGTLILVKFAAWLATDSVGVLSTLIDSALDALASLINLVAVRHALQPADREHRFGHGKAESLAGLAQAAFITGSALFLVIEALQRLFRPEPIEEGWIAIVVMMFSIVLTAALVVFQGFVVRRTRSLAIRSDSLHFVGDLLTNAGVILALLLVDALGWLAADPIIALVIAAVVFYSAYRILRQAYDMLMDREFPDDQRRRVREIALSNAEVLGVHDLRTRTSGRDSFVQMHLVLPAAMSLKRAHEISDEVEARIRAAYPGAEVIIHQDPEGLVEGHATFR
jgi:ferrous-iron efflux pump FieF